MKTMGFIVDKNLFKVAKMLQDKVYCKIPDSSLDSEAICQLAVKENRIFITTNLKLFNKKLTIPRCCVAFKASPFSKTALFNDSVDQYKAIATFFSIV